MKCGLIYLSTAQANLRYSCTNEALSLIRVALFAYYIVQQSKVITIIRTNIDYS
jgi:hypothetical protein